MHISTPSKCTSLLAFLLLLTPHITTAKKGPTAAEYGVVLNLSGRQRMLTQKMSKEVLLIALNIDSQNNRKNLKNTASLFDTTLKGLKNGSETLKLPPTTSKRILRQLSKVKKLWTPFQKQVKSILNKKSIEKSDVELISTTNLSLLKEMNRCVKLYEKDAAKAGLKSAPGLAVSINLSGKQRMLTQKMSKEYLLIAYSASPDINKLNLQETAELFERTLTGLHKGDQVLDLPGTTNKQITDQLNVVQTLWGNFGPTIKSAYKSPKKITEDQIQQLAEKNIPLLKEMNKAVKMFEKEAAK